jgi:hypothetical protein
MFHLHVSKVNLVLHILQLLYSHVSNVSSIFRRILQMFYLDVSKVDLVLQADVRLLVVVRHCGSRVGA